MKPIAVWALLVPLAGEYTVLPTLQRRFLDGEASPQIGVTLLREGATPILCGRPSTAEPRGTLRAGSFKGARYAPRGQEFPSVEGYSAKVSCEASATGAQRSPRAAMAAA